VVWERQSSQNLQIFNTSASALSGTGSHVFSGRRSRLTATLYEFAHETAIYRNQPKHNFTGEGKNLKYP